MKKALQVCLLGSVAALFVVRAASPFAGTWEGSRKGVKAVILTVRETGAELHGDVLFYVLRDDGDGMRIVGEDRRAMVNPHSDGKALRFTVGPPEFDPEAPSVRFEMTVIGDKAELKLLGNDDQPVPMVRR